jgi:adenylylsulfate kinase
MKALAAGEQGGKKNTNIVYHRPTISKKDKELLNHHRSVVVWFTGFSASGKSTIAHAVEHQLYQRKCRSFVFDGDNVRHGLCSDLGFSPEDRAENIRRIGEMVKLFTEAGIISLTAFISPFRADRKKVKDLVGHENFIEVYCSCPLAVCEQRDVKGHYRRAKAGEIKEFTGVSSPYEEPRDPDLVLDTSALAIEQCVAQVMDLLLARGIISRQRKRRL